MKKTKKFLSLVLAVLMLLSIMPYAVSVNALETTGQCGDNVYWEYDENVKTLSLNGYGDTWNFGTGEHTSPFMDYANEIEKIIVGEGITRIGDLFFYFGGGAYRAGVKSVYLPKSLKEIGESAFLFCANLETVLGSNNVTKIGRTAFGLCIKLTSIELNNIESINAGAFLGCYSLEDINLNNVKYIGDSAFTQCFSLADSNFSNVESIGNSAFAWCMSLENIVLPLTLNSIGEDAFNECLYLNETYINNPQTNFAKNALGVRSYKIKNGYKDLFVERLVDAFCSDNISNDELLVIEKELLEYIIEYETPKTQGTLICYKGSTAETYAIENGVDYRYFSGEKPVLPDDENDEPYHPISYEPRINCDDTSAEFYQNAILGGNWKTFKITGEITNYDEYHNLENVWITIKSPDGNIIKFDSNEKSEVTFPLGRSIGTQKSSEFKCKAFVNRDYMPAGGTDTLTLTCILNGELDGKKVEGVYTTFNVKVTNLSYKENKPKRNKSMKDLISELKSMVSPFESYYRSNIGRLIGGTALFEDFTAVEMAYSIGATTSSLELAETVYDIGYYFSSMKLSPTKKYGKMFMDQLSEDSNDKVKEIIGAMESRLLSNTYFNDFIKWCCEEYGVDIGEYAKYSNHCPTDIIVTDEFGDVVLKIINDEIVVCNDYVFVDVFESKKTFYLPTDIDYEIKITATDNGTMDYFVETLTKDGERRVIEYNDISLIKGDFYTATAPTDILSDTYIYNLISQNGQVVAGKEKINHNFSDDFLCEKTATCILPGIGIFDCTECNYSETRTIAPTGHVFSESSTKCVNCDYDKADDCSCNCHAGGIKAFFFKILNFFQKLFGQNKVCACGAKH